jgi:hypothetical protein
MDGLLTNHVEEDDGTIFQKRLRALNITVSASDVKIAMLNYTRRKCLPDLGRDDFLRFFKSTNFKLLI